MAKPGISLFESERPRRKRATHAEPRDKYGRRRSKCRAAGRCPHCGRPCAPYAECQQRRTYKRLSHALRILVKRGDIRKLKPGLYQAA